MKLASRIGELRPSAIRAAGKLIASKPGCITFAGGYPASEVMPVEEVVELTDQLVRDYGRTSMQYGLTKGNDDLMEQIVKLMEKKGIKCGIENIQITTGSQQAIFLTGMLTLDKGDAVVVENPTYLGALSAYVPYEAEFIGVDADEEGMIMSELEKTLQENKNVKLIYVVPNFSNPTGKTWSLERRKQLLEMAKKYDVLIAEDNPYGDIRFSGEPVPEIKSMDDEGRVIYMGSFSKVLFAGLRVGFTVSSKEIADYFEIFKQGVDLQSNEFAQLQIAGYLKNYDLDKQVQRIVKNCSVKRDLMCKIIDEKFPKSVKRTNPEGGMFVWIELPENIDASVLLEKAVEEIGVGYVPGGPFYADGSHKNTIRLNFSTVTAEQIEEGMTRFAKLLHEELD